jgi:AraC family transcriptional regulator
MQFARSMTDSDSGQISAGDIIRSDAWQGLRCYEVLYEPRLRLAAHEHDLPFFGIALCGSYEETTGGVRYEYEPGSVVFHPSHEEHALTINDAAIRCFIVELDTVAIEQRFECVLPASMPRVDGSAFTLLMEMYREFRLGDSSAALSLQGLLLQLIATVSRGIDTRADTGRSSLLDRLDQFLRVHFRSQLTLDEIAAAVGAPPARLSGMFRASYGRSIAEEQRRLRIEHACRRMLDPSLSLADIALECGFADQPHFSRAFRQIKGMPPARYRALLT